MIFIASEFFVDYYTIDWTTDTAYYGNFYHFDNGNGGEMTYNRLFMFN